MFDSPDTPVLDTDKKKDVPQIKNRIILVFFMGLIKNLLNRLLTLFSPYILGLTPLHTIAKLCLNDNTLPVFLLFVLN